MARAANHAILGTTGSIPTYIEDVFSTYLYTGNDSTQTITNGIDLAGKGGLVWMKSRTDIASHALYDTVRGATKEIESQSTSGEATRATGLTAFNSNGFSIGSRATINSVSQNYVSWTFREQSKFFDVVTYTGNGTARTISHNLGSVPGCIIVKRTDTTGDWQVYHRANTANPETDYLVLNSTAATADSDTRWNDTLPTSTVFSLGTDATVNANGGTYVAYLFAHDAGGFGASGSDNVITCGSYTSATAINLGYEPQWLMVKSATISGQWYIINNMTGFTSSAFGPRLIANLANAEGNDSVASVTATGFNSQLVDGAGTYIYIAIRRGPMKTPTDATKVFYPAATTGSTVITTGFPVDLAIFGNRSGSGTDHFLTWDRMRGSLAWMRTAYTDAESSTTSTYETVFDNNTQTNYKWHDNTVNIAGWNFRRAPGFFDVVCYTGTAANRTQTHNLGAVPELIIVKMRSATAGWYVYSSALGATKYLVLDTTAAEATLSTLWNDTAPTSSVFSLGTNSASNGSSKTYVAYLFSSVNGVSKVGSYTGNGSSQTINCGFTAGARFILIKRTDSTGDWYVYDSARGIVSGNDPQLKLNTTDAEATGYDAIDPDNSGFIVNNDATNFPINVNNATYIYFAIA